MECLKVLRLLAILMSKGTVFHNLAADGKTEFSKRDFLSLEYASNHCQLIVCLLLWVSETFMNKSVMYSVAI